MNTKLMPVAIFVLVAVMAASFLLPMGRGKEVPSVPLGTLDFGQGRAMDFTVEPNSQQTLSLHYTARAGDQVQVEHAFFGTLPRTSPPPTFIAVTPEGSPLVAVAQASAPKQIVILHDFANQESFPQRLVSYKDTDPEHLYPYFEDQESILARGDALFGRLQQLVPDGDRQLLRTMGTRPLVIPEPEAEGHEGTENNP